jgi:hypothetical protein
MLDPELPSHPGTLCASGERAVELALELGRAKLRIAELEAELARRRYDQAHPYDFEIVYDDAEQERKTPPVPEDGGEQYSRVYPDAGDTVPLDLAH